MRLCSWSVFVPLCLLVMLAVPTGSQARSRGARATNTTNHGDRAYRDALSFARQHNLPHFTTRSRGTQRVVVNVPTNKIQDWCQVFSKQNCYIEPFFSASNRSAPSWSYLRIGDKSYNKYGPGSQYRPGTYGGRVSFPCSVSTQELSTTENKIHTSPNGRWNYNGGNPESTGRNCTNWLTYKIGQFTGVRTASVKGHMSSLVRGYHSNRMSVMAVMSQNPIQNFGQDQLQLQWH